MKKILLILSMFQFVANAQIVNKFRDSTWFKSGVQFDGNVVFKSGAGSGKVWTSNSNGTGSWQTISTGSGTVTSVATNTGSGITGGTITSTGTLAIDTTKVSTKSNVTAQLLNYTTNTKLTDSLDTKTNKLITANRQTSSYTLVLSDRDKLVEMNVGSANNLTVPLNSSVAFAIGTQILIAQYGAGQTTIVATGGVTINSANGKLKLTTQFSGATLLKIGTNEWYLFGDITN